MLATAFGGHVITTAGSDEKCAAARKLGADVAVNYRTQDFVEETKKATGGKGADVILDIVGGDYLAQNLEALGVEGRLVVIGLLGGARGALDLGRMLTRRLTVTASTLRPRSPEEKGRIAVALRTRVWPLLESRAIAPVVQATFPLDEAARAHEILEANAALGKIALVVHETI